MILIGDTSGLVAAFNRDDPLHKAARQVLSASPALVVSPLVMHEIEHVMTRNVGRREAHAVNDWILAGEDALRVVIAEVDAVCLRRARRVQSAYAALRLDLADAVNVVLAAQFETAAILTLDRRDFRAIAPLTPHAAFRILPDDA